MSLTVTFYDHMTRDERTAIETAFQLMLEYNTLQPPPPSPSRYTLANVFGVTTWFDACETYMETYLARNPHHTYTKGAQWDNRRQTPRELWTKL